MLNEAITRKMRIETSLFQDSEAKLLIRYVHDEGMGA